MRRLAWTSRALALTLIPHVVVATVANWPLSLVVFHVGATVFTGLAAVVIGCSRIRDDRESALIRAAYDAGRVSLVEKFDEFEQRIVDRT